MDKNKKKFVELGEKANYFHDPYTGLTISRGEVKELTAEQALSKRVKSGLAQGHISYAEAPSNTSSNLPSLEDTQVKFEKLKEALKSDVDAMAKKFNMDELKVLAEAHEIVIEAGDSKADIIKAILE